MPVSAPTFLRHGRIAVLAVLGVGQIIAWGGTFYLPAVLAELIARDTGWPLAWVVGGLSVGTLVSGLVSPSVGALVERHGGRPVLAASSAALAFGLLLLAVARGWAFSCSPGSCSGWAWGRVSTTRPSPPSAGSMGERRAARSPRSP